MIFSSKDCVLTIRKIIVVGFSGLPVKGGGKIRGGGGRGPPPGKFPEIFFGNFRKFPEKFPVFTSLNERNHSLVCVLRIFDGIAKCPCCKRKALFTLQQNDAIIGL
jgi:hypothetical protein